MLFLRPTPSQMPDLDEESGQLPMVQQDNEKPMRSAAMTDVFLSQTLGTITSPGKKMITPGAQATSSN